MTPPIYMNACGQCRFCKESHPFGCPRVATRSDIDSVMASAIYLENQSLQGRGIPTAGLAVGKRDGQGSEQLCVPSPCPSY